MKLENLRKKQTLEFCKACVTHYLEYLNEDEILLIQNILQNSLYQENDVQRLYPIAEKIWNKELETGNYVVVSWSKYANQKRKKFITFATFSKRDDITSFCDSDLGIEYEITYQSIIGALNKDGATLIEDLDKKNEYTLAVIQDKVINSYNGATKLITPIQVLDQSDNQYHSKHNELILDSRYIREKQEIHISR